MKEVAIIITLIVVACLLFVYANFEKIKEWVKYHCFNIPRLLYWYAHSNIIKRSLSIVLGALFFIYEMWNDAPIIEAMSPWFQILIWSLFTIVLSSAITASFVKQPNDASIYLSNFISSMGAIVTAKSQRLVDSVVPKAIASDKRADAFIEPVEQIRSIFRIGTEFLQSSYDLRQDQIDITILSKEGKSWNYLYRHQEAWRHTTASTITSNPKSLASHCLKDMQPAFYPCKKHASKKGKYLLSPRDKKFDCVGSVFCHPFELQSGNKKWTYLITIVTYEHTLCYYGDKVGKQTAYNFLDEICKRIKIELINRVIKESSSRNHAKRKKHSPAKKRKTRGNQKPKGSTSVRPNEDIR